MENPVDEAELLGLPAELDDIFIANERFFNSESGQTHSFPTEFPYEFDSSPALSSPVESVIGSAETESSDEEEFFAGLTQRLTQFSLGETQQFPKKSEKLVASGSPQSTLNGIGSWSFNSVSSENGSPNGISSPPTAADGGADTWDLIYQAAGQVARLKMSNEVANNNFNTQIKGLLTTPSRVNPNIGLYSNNQNNLIYTNQYNCPRHEQKPAALWGRQQLKVGNNGWQPPLSHGRVRNHVFNIENGRNSFGLSHSAWPPLQQQKSLLPESGMRAVFLQGSGVKRESAGTGVFLPRRYGTPPIESRKKSGCSTVLVPAKVVQALNLQRANPNFTPNYDAVFARNAILAQQKRNNLNQCPEAALPQDWSY